MKNADYWRGRFAILEDAAQREADHCISDLEKMFREAERTVQANIERWYGRFAANNQISLSDARKLLTTGQLEEFRWTVDQYIQAAKSANLSPEWIKKLENASARFHISRLESVQLQIQQQLELLYGNQLDSIDDLLKQIVSNGYGKSAFEIHKGLGIGWDITAVNPKRLETLLSKPWTTNKKTFRDHCWEGKVNLVSGIQTQLTQGLLRGDSHQKITAAISKQFGVSRYKAGRLVHTETTYFNAISALESYKELDVERVEIIATLDSYTCKICGPLDGMVIPIPQYEPGVTVPPYHPNCRCTTAPVIEDEDAIGERAARDQDGKVYYVPANMKYFDWFKTFVEGGSKDALTLAATGVILDSTKRKGEGSGVQTVGRIDIEKYRCITDDVTTDEVIITDERIQHIMERHPGDFERYMGYIAEIVADPDYILEANKPNTGVILKEIEDQGEKFKLILRVRIESDPADYKNSVLSFWHIGDTTWNKNVKNKKILYKRE